MSQMNRKVILDVEDLQVYFPIREKGQYFWEKPQQLKAVDGVSLQLYEGETLGVVGESGCGKSTLARAIIGLAPISKGSITWLGQDITQANKQGLQSIRQDIQMIFQDPLASLNPRMTVGEIIAEPLKAHYPKLNKSLVKDQVKQMMEKVGLLPNVVNRYPHEFSGGNVNESELLGH